MNVGFAIPFPYLGMAPADPLDAEYSPVGPSRVVDADVLGALDDVVPLEEVPLEPSSSNKVQ